MFGGIHQSRGPCHVGRSNQSMIYRLASRLSRHNKFSVSVTSRFCSERIETATRWLGSGRSLFFFSFLFSSSQALNKIASRFQLTARSPYNSLSLFLLTAIYPPYFQLHRVFDRFFYTPNDETNREEVQLMKIFFEIQSFILISFTRNGRNSLFQFQCLAKSNFCQTCGISSMYDCMNLYTWEPLEGVGRWRGKDTSSRSKSASTSLIAIRHI